MLAVGGQVLFYRVYFDWEQLRGPSTESSERHFFQERSV